ncbi:FAD-dependent oxidoreductase [Microcoleus sp. Pol7_A1]|uniref:FAD-dependent oxidoreductase n=1 Tax=Microcoleus sp. Pol7_A1 TaxID=2818893 RepID=UPI002FD59447
MSETKERTTKTNKEALIPDTILDVQQTTCCIVGGGPAGAVLALILARQGISVILLEAHKTFERDFRGDLIHAGAMEIMDELGICDRLLEHIPHTKTDKMEFITSEQRVTFADFSRLKSKHSYITILSQGKLLSFLTIEAKRYPNFQLVMGANVQQLIEENGVITGVRYRGSGGWHEVRSQLTVAADGRFSNMRKLSGMELIEAVAPIDVCWFRLPRNAEEPEGGVSIRLGSKRALVVYKTFDGNWQIGFNIPKGHYQQLQAKGIEAMRQSIVGVVPEFADRVEHLKDWKQVTLLLVAVGRLPRWYRQGLLLIGDAAHVMSPLGGVGITYAIHDAVAAANVLSEPLKAGQLQISHLAAVQRQRELPIKVIQAFQYFTQTQVNAKALRADNTLRLPIYWGLPLLPDIVARLLAFGIFPPHLKAKLRFV